MVLLHIHSTPFYNFGYFVLLNARGKSDVKDVSGKKGANTSVWLKGRTSRQAEHPRSSAAVWIFMAGVRRIRLLYPHHLSHVPPFFVAAPLWWQFAVKLPLSQTFFSLLCLSLTPALSIWQSRAARALNHPVCSGLGCVASPWLPAGACSWLLFCCFLRSWCILTLSKSQGLGC